MTERWIIYNKSADFYGLGDKYHIDPVVARVIRNRDIFEDGMEEYLYPEIAKLHAPYMMKDIDKAVDILDRDIQECNSIRIISDYDADGVMSNYILYKGLVELGAKVDYDIPDRIQDGYGINENMIKRAFDEGINTILTCDNGISAISQIKYAKDLGMTVIVTDHHDIPYEMDEDGNKVFQKVNADAVVNPKQEECDYPFKELCGAGVAYKLMEALYAANEHELGEIQKYLEYVAIATVCDVMPLVGENRVFVKNGLERLNNCTNIGLKALIEANELSDKKLSTYHLGFVIGPCINATGRLNSAKLSLKLLLETDEKEAINQAINLKEINDNRKEMTVEATEIAIKQVEESNMLEEKVLVVYLPDCHESLAGIIAGRIKEKYYRPTLVITKGEDNLVKGSGRSIEEYNMYEELTECKKLLVKFGGHPLAAGLTLFESNIDSLRQKLNLNCKLSDNDILPKLKIDVAMPVDYISEKFIEQLSVLEPFGKGNEKPVFAHRNLKVNSAKIFGVNRNVIKLILESDVGTSIEAVYFNPEEFTDRITQWFGYEECDKMLHGWLNSVRLNVAYYPTINTYRDTTNIQLTLISYAKYEE